MNQIEPDEARDLLGQVRDITERTRRTIVYGGGDVIFIAWGIVWLLGFVGTHILPYLLYNKGPEVVYWSIQGMWFVLVAGGVLVTIFSSRKIQTVRSPLSRQIGLMWWMLYIYVILWGFLVGPFLNVRGYEQSAEFWRHMGALLATIPMFGYVMMGIILDKFMVWLGLTITALTILGLFLLQSHFFIWMAAAGGGTLIGTGIYIRSRWK